MNSKKINQLATELTPSLSDLTIIGDPSTGVSKKITLSQMASLFTGTVEEYPSFASLPLVGVADTIYITTDTNILYRWDTTLSAYAELSPNIVTSLVFSDANGFDGNISLVGSVATLTITTALTQGSVSFIGASGALSQDNDNFFWDDTNNRLGIGTKLPTTALDVFGSGIIGRVNGTSTNNAFLGFASAGSNKWSIGNVQSDHRFRIYNEATTSELVSVLQTGEFGIGIANPTTKLHIDGGASALIANLDANVSVAKSISFRSDNSARINLEVSGTESGSNAGANFYLRTYTDAGSLLNTPLTITRATGDIAFTGIVSVSMGSDTSYGKLNIKSNSTNAYAGINVFANTNDRFIALNHTGTVGVIEVNNAGSAIMTPLVFRINGDERMRINTSGNVGIGTNNPTGAQLHISAANETLRLDTTSASYDASLRFYNNSSATYWGGIQAGPGAFSGGGINIFGNGAYPMIFSVNGSERMRIDSAGNIGIGTTTPSTYSSGGLTLGTSSSGKNLILYSSIDGGNGVVQFIDKNGSSAMQVGGNATDMYIYGYGNRPMYFATNDVERMRLTAGGTLCINRTTTPNNSYPFLIKAKSGDYIFRYYSTSESKGGDQYIGDSDGFFHWRNGNGDVWLTTSANTNWQTTSDKTLKTNFKLIDNALDKINLLNGYYYNPIDDLTVNRVGVIAQEVLEVLPEAVSKSFSKTHDREVLGVSYDDLIPLLINGIKELKAEIDVLKNK